MPASRDLWSREARFSLCERPLVKRSGQSEKRIIFGEAERDHESSKEGFSFLPQSKKFKQPLRFEILFEWRLDSLLPFTEYVIERWQSGRCVLKKTIGADLMGFLGSSDDF